MLPRLRKPATQEVGHSANHTLASTVPPRHAVPCPVQVCHIPRGARPGCSGSPGVGATQLVACRHVGNSETCDSEPPTTQLSQSAWAVAGSPAPTSSQRGSEHLSPCEPVGVPGRRVLPLPEPRSNKQLTALHLHTVHSQRPEMCFPVTSRPWGHPASSPGCLHALGRPDLLPGPNGPEPRRPWLASSSLPRAPMNSLCLGLLSSEVSH